MAENLVIESPDFDAIGNKAGQATRDAINLLWSVLNQEVLTRRKAVRDAKQTLEVLPLATPVTTSQNNFDTERATIVYFTGASALNLTGIRNGIEGALKLIHVTGAGTITIKNASGSSDASNMILTSTGADKAVATGKSILLAYLNSRWREQSLV